MPDCSLQCQSWSLAANGKRAPRLRRSRRAVGGVSVACKTDFRYSNSPFDTELCEEVAGNRGKCCEGRTLRTLKFWSIDRWSRAENLHLSEATDLWCSKQLVRKAQHRFQFRIEPQPDTDKDYCGWSTVNALGSQAGNVSLRDSHKSVVSVVCSISLISALCRLIMFIWFIWLNQSCGRRSTRNQPKVRVRLELVEILIGRWAVKSQITNEQFEEED